MCVDNGRQGLALVGQLCGSDNPYRESQGDGFWAWAAGDNGVPKPVSWAQKEHQPFLEIYPLSGCSWSTPVQCQQLTSVSTSGNMVTQGLPVGLQTPGPQASRV